jgi:hypothetical protein
VLHIVHYGELIFVQEATNAQLQICSAVLLTEYHSNDQVKKTEMGRTCGTYGGEERCIQGFSWEN